jgi:hypothetical protein
LTKYSFSNKLCNCRADSSFYRDLASLKRRWAFEIVRQSDKRGTERHFADGAVLPGANHQRPETGSDG